METQRRDFLKGAVGATAATAGLTATVAPVAAQSTPVPSASFEMPRGMTLLNMRRDRGIGLGVRTERGILDVTAAATGLGVPAPVDMDDLLQNGKGQMLRALVDTAASRGTSALYLREDAIAYAPLVTRPEKIIMMGFNYRKHAEETGTPVPKDPPLFNKFNNALNHHGGTIKLPTHAAREFDYEVELVVVFGKKCANVSEADALDYVAGYATGNDFSARDLQTLTSQFMIGKTSDGFAPLGPPPRDQRSREGPQQSAARDACQRHPAAGLEHQRHDLQLPPADQLRLARDDHSAWRHLVHWHAAGRDLR